MDNYGQNGGINNTGFNSVQQSPADIYNNMQNGDAPFGGEPQYHYGPATPVMNGRYYYEQQQRAVNLRAQKSAIRRGATPVAVGMALFWIFGMIFSVILIKTRLSLLYSYDSLASSAIGVFYTVAVVFVPFLICAYIFKKTKGVGLPSLDKPETPPLKTALLIIIAFGGCMLANFITNVFTTTLEHFGVFFEIPDSPEPSDFAELAVMFIGTAVVPPLIEEFAMRGVVLGNLRKYGDGLAILASAFSFGVFHANPSQIPFAFMCGILLGYIAVETGSLWTSIIVHMLVNSLSCVYPAVALYANETVADSVVTVLIYVALFAGAVALAMYLYLFKPTNKRRASGSLSNASKFAVFVSNPGIIIMTVIFLVEAVSGYVTLQSGSFS